MYRYVYANLVMYICFSNDKDIVDGTEFTEALVIQVNFQQLFYQCMSTAVLDVIIGHSVSTLLNCCICNISNINQQL